MRIALLSFEYPPETGFGGIGTYTWYQARALVKLGHEVHVLAGATEPTGLRTTEHDGVQVHRFRADGPLMRSFAALGRQRLWWTRNRLENAWSMHLGLRRLRRRMRFDLVEAPECGAEAMLLDRPAGERLVVRFHSPARLIMPFYDTTRRDAAWCARAEWRGIRRAHALTSCSRFLADEAQTALGEARPVEVIPNGIDLALFDAADQVDFRRTHALPADRPMVLFAGRMEPRKGIHVVGELALPLLERHEVALVLAGEDLFGHVARSVAPALAGRRLRGSFHFLGRLDPVAMRSAMRQADIVLLPSLWESCPYACLEAMAAGRAVVASDQGGMPEMIEDGASGVLAACGIAADNLARLEQLLDHTELRSRLGTAARRVVEARFTDVAVAQASVRHHAMAA